VALARALINRPRVLLLDEPLGALDLKLRRQMQIELKRIQTEVGVTFLHVTHDQEEAMWMAETVAVMNAGRVEQMGPPAEIYEFPATRYVATFLGKSNLLAGRITGASGADVTVEVSGGRFALPAARNRAASKSVYLGVRPEKVRIVGSADTVPDGDNRLAGVITDTCYVGVSTEYLVRADWGQELSVFSSNATADGPLPPGTKIVLHWHPVHSFLLDRSETTEGTAPEPPEPELLAPGEDSRFEGVR